MYRSVFAGHHASEGQQQSDPPSKVRVSQIELESPLASEPRTNAGDALLQPVNRTRRTLLHQFAKPRTRLRFDLVG